MSLKKVQFLKLEEKLPPTLETAQKINIDFTTLWNYPHWYQSRDKLYYFRKLNDNLNLQELITYLICEKVAQFFQLPVVHFNFAKYKEQIGLASLNFRLPNQEYIYFDYELVDYQRNLQESLEYLKRYFSDENNYQKFQNEILRLIAFQIYTNLIDLKARNILLLKAEDGYALAPVYDFDFALKNKLNINEFFYDSTIASFYIPSNSFKETLENYPYLKEWLNKILTIDMKSIMYQIAQEYALDFDYKKMQYYERQDIIKKEFIRRLHL